MDLFFLFVDDKKTRNNLSGHTFHIMLALLIVFLCMLTCLHCYSLYVCWNLAHDVAFIDFEVSCLFSVACADFCLTVLLAASVQFSVLPVTVCYSYSPRNKHLNVPRCHFSFEFVQMQRKPHCACCVMHIFSSYSAQRKSLPGPRGYPVRVVMLTRKG